MTWQQAFLLQRQERLCTSGQQRHQAAGTRTPLKRYWFGWLLFDYKTHLNYNMKRDETMLQILLSYILK